MTVGELVQRTAVRPSAPELLGEDPEQEARELMSHALGASPEQLGRCARDRVDVRLPGWLAPGVHARECDPSQVEKVLELLTAAGLREPRAHADKPGVRRVLSAQKP